MSIDKLRSGLMRAFATIRKQEFISKAVEKARGCVRVSKVVVVVMVVVREGIRCVMQHTALTRRFQHYAYMSHGPNVARSDGVKPQLRAAREYIQENGMDKTARVVEADDLDGYDDSAFYQLRHTGSKRGVHQGKWLGEDDDSTGAGEFCAARLQQLGVTLPSQLARFHSGARRRAPRTALLVLFSALVLSI